MKLRTFTAPDMPTAMKLIKAELGPDAVILATHAERGRKSIRVTAAVETETEKPSFEDYKSTIESARKRQHNREWQGQLTEILEFHRTPEEVIKTCIKAAERVDLDQLLMLQKLAATPSKTIVMAKALALILEQAYSFAALPILEPGKRFCFVGPVGAGKTLTTAKLATELVLDKKPVSVVSLDNKRAGGIEQLAAYTDIMDTPLYTATNKSELQEIIRTIPLSHITLIDTPGCNPHDLKELEQMEHMLDTSGIDQVLVIPAGLDSFESVDIAKSFACPALRRILVTRMDASSRFGNILAAAQAGELAFCNYAASSRVVDRCTRMDAAILAQFLLQHFTPTR